MGPRPRGRADRPPSRVLLFVTILIGVAGIGATVPFFGWDRPYADGLTASGAPPYAIRDLGTLPDGANSMATAISDRGQVVGWSTDASGARHAFLWEDGVVADLGHLGGGLSEATDINAVGQVVGWSTNASGKSRAFLWQDGVMSDLGDLGGEESRALDVNAAGKVVGWSTNASGGMRPFLWERGVMTDLGIPDATAEYPRHWAAAINEEGQVVVVSDGGRQDDICCIAARTFLWEAGVYTDVRPRDDPQDFGEDINNDGQVAGWSGGFSRFTGAWVWQGGVTAFLPSLGGFEGQAHGINEAGHVVGEDTTDGSPFRVRHGVLWMDGVLTDLGALVEGGHSWAFDIDNTGRIIGLATTADGSVHAVLWTR